MSCIFFCGWWENKKNTTVVGKRKKLIMNKNKYVNDNLNIAMTMGKEEKKKRK